MTWRSSSAKVQHRRCAHFIRIDKHTGTGFSVYLGVCRKVSPGVSGHYATGASAVLLVWLQVVQLEVARQGCQIVCGFAELQGRSGLINGCAFLQGVDGFFVKHD